MLHILDSELLLRVDFSRAQTEQKNMQHVILWSGSVPITSDVVTKSKQPGKKDHDKSEQSPGKNKVDHYRFMTQIKKGNRLMDYRGFLVRGQNPNCARLSRHRKENVDLIKAES